MDKLEGASSSEAPSRRLGPLSELLKRPIVAIVVAVAIAAALVGGLLVLSGGLHNDVPVRKVTRAGADLLKVNPYADWEGAYQLVLKGADEEYGNGDGVATIAEVCAEMRADQGSDDAEVVAWCGPPR